MARRAIEYIKEMEQAVGGRLDPRLNPLQILNDAGAWMYQAHEWAWLDPPPVSLDLVADQAFVDLPADFGSIRSVESQNNYLRIAKVTAMSFITYLRGNTAIFTLNRYLSPAWTDANSPRLELYPVPSEDSSGFALLSYRKAWVSLTSNQSVADVPVGMELLLTELCRLIAMAKQERQSVAGVLASFKRGDFFQTYSEDDGMSGGYNLGKTKRGHVPRRRRERVIYLHDSITFP